MRCHSNFELEKKKASYFNRNEGENTRKKTKKEKNNFDRVTPAIEWDSTFVSKASCSYFALIKEILCFLFLLSILR